MTEPLATPVGGFSSDDHRYMAQALRLAAKGLHSARPNPRVGCVLVREGALVGQGWHRRAGEPHAEVNALTDAGKAAQGATAYVSLEPCSHHGRTPPCVDALLAAGVARVVVAMVDPNPEVAGQGLARLAEHGVIVQGGLMSTEAAALNAGFVSRMERGRPWVRLKLACSLDGRTAMASGESKWITGEAARRDVHGWRARSCAVLSGIDTVLADDPALTVRDHPALTDITAQPLRVVADSALRLPADAGLLSLPGHTLVCTTSTDADRRGALESAGAEILLVPPDHAGRVDLAALMQALGRRAVNEVLVEAGPTLGGALLQQGLVDEVLVYQAMHLMGASARPLVSLPGLETMASRRCLRLRDVRQFGDDLRLRLEPMED